MQTWDLHGCAGQHVCCQGALGLDWCLAVVPCCHDCWGVVTQVLYNFLVEFSNFDWDHYCLSLQGPVPIKDLPSSHGERNEAKEGMACGFPVGAVDLTALCAACSVHTGETAQMHCN